MRCAGAMGVSTLLVLVLVLSGRRGADAFGQNAYGTLYQLGKEAYLEEDYRSCVSLLLQALQEQREFEQLLLDCRNRCRREAAAETLLLADESSGELASFERLIRETRCLVQCHRDRLGEHLQPYYDSAWADDEFRDKKPYEYLQLCYYKTGEVQKAANAVFTVLLKQPKNEIMRENFKYYTTMEGVDNANIVSLEPQEHTELYVRGNDAYESARWPQVTRLMEDALDGFLEAEQRCRTLCERFFPQGFNPDFVANVANHFAYVLRCKIRCPDQLSTVAGNYLSDYLESHFHYLQFAYFKQNMLQEACSNVASYLLFKPNDEDMIGNKRLYLKEEGVDESFFTLRPDMLELFKRREREKKLDNYILENFRFSDGEASKKGDGILQGSNADITSPQDEKTRRSFSTTRGGPAEDPGPGQGDPGEGQGDPGEGQGDPGGGQGDPGTSQGDPGTGQGDSGIDQRDYGIDQGDYGIDQGDHGIDQGDHGIDQGDPGIDQGDSRIEQGDQGTDQGNDGIDQGDDGIDQGDDGIDQGNDGIDQGDHGIDQGDQGIDQDDPGGGQGDPESGQGDPGTSQGDLGGQSDPGIDQGDPGIGQGDPGIGQGDPGVGPAGDPPASGALLALHSRLIPAVSAPPGPWVGRAVVTSGPAELGGQQRFVADHLLTHRECQRLTGVLQVAGAVGDGYRTRTPLSPGEDFRGLSFGRLVTNVDRGDASREDLQFLMDVTDSARILVARQLGVDELYSSFTHLVSRTHIPDLSLNRSRSELSHSVHVDNCKLFTNGTCSRGRGAYIHRHFSAILYLNDDFSGGEFVFADNIVSRKPTVRVQPHCGRLVGFSAGPENPHGVLAVTGGSRYALAMWYTRTRRQREEERMVADLYLRDSSTPEVRLMVSILERNFELADKLLRK